MSQQIREPFLNGEVSYIDTIERLQKIGYSAKEAEELVMK